MDKTTPVRIGITAGGVKNGKLTWLTRRRVQAAVKAAKDYEGRGVLFFYAFVPTSPANDAHSVLRQVIKTLHPEYDGEVLTPPEDHQIRGQKERDEFLKRVAQARGETTTIVRAF